ncbi:MAG: hypothetical protein R2873_26225 [Caldilineaceae bacterium]
MPASPTTEAAPVARTVTWRRPNLAAAQASLQQLYSGPREADRIAAESALANAESAQAAQPAYDRVLAQRRGDATRKRSASAGHQRLHRGPGPLRRPLSGPDADGGGGAGTVQAAQAAGLGSSEPGRATAGQLAEAERRRYAARRSVDPHRGTRRRLLAPGLRLSPKPRPP